MNSSTFAFGAHTNRLPERASRNSRWVSSPLPSPKAMLKGSAVSKQVATRKAALPLPRPLPFLRRRPNMWIGSSWLICMSRV